MIDDNTPKAVLAIGSPVVDQVAHVPEDFIQGTHGAKGGMELVDAAALGRLLAALPRPPVKTPGGSAGNTAFALARMGMCSRFLGIVGSDVAGQYYRDRFVRIGGDAGSIRIRDDLPTAQCVSLVTPDGERTMRTHLGAAASLNPADVTAADFAGCAHAHIEGYLLFNPDLMHHVLQTAKSAGCRTSLDLASFEVVASAQERLPGLLQRYVDIVLANEEEAEAYAGNSDPQRCVQILGECCGTAVVKCGADGALIRGSRGICRVPAVRVDKVIDTTGAGDLWAAGFLYGLHNGYDLAQCGAFGAILGATVVQYEGAMIPDSEWDRITSRLAA